MQACIAHCIHGKSFIGVPKKCEIICVRAVDRAIPIERGIKKRSKEMIAKKSKSTVQWAIEKSLILLSQWWEKKINLRHNYFTFLRAPIIFSPTVHIANI